MSKRRPLPSAHALWAEHENNVLTAVRLALQMLRDRNDLPAEEVGLNRALVFALRDAIYELDPHGVVYVSEPICEAHNQPDASDEVRGTREDKVPDFQWGFRDVTAEAARAFRYYAVECKRLGRTIQGSRWMLNVNYVNNGIVRFLDRKWGYGMSCPSGAMIGYVQNMELDKILYEVNEVANSLGIPDLELEPKGWQSADVSHLDHGLDRSFVINAFDLRHLWIDLRKQS